MSVCFFFNVREDLLLGCGSFLLDAFLVENCSKSNLSHDDVPEDNVFFFPWLILQKPTTNSQSPKQKHHIEVQEPYGKTSSKHSKRIKKENTSTLKMCDIFCCGGSSHPIPPQKKKNTTNP